MVQTARRSRVIERKAPNPLLWKCSVDHHDVIRRLKEREPDLRARGVTHAALFGSVARGEERPDSDIDIMVEIASDRQMDLFSYMGIVHFIEDMFPVRVDVANHARLKAFVRAGAERDAIYAF
jgi:predicted nucleotidyltransferase